MFSRPKPVTFAMDQPLTIDLQDNPSALCKKASVSPLLQFKTSGTTSRFFDRSADSAISSHYDTSPHSSTGSSNLSERTSVSTYCPIIIGDRVYVGPSRLTGTVAYMGPTHFATGDMVGVVLDSPKGKHDGEAYGIRYFQCPQRCGLFCRLDNLKPMDAVRHSPNCRIRTESILNSINCPTNGLNYRRVSLTNQSPLARSYSARFSRRHPQIASVVGTIGANTELPAYSFEISSLRRSKSDRLKSTRPQWKPPGSPTAKINSQKSKTLVHSQTLPRSAKSNKRLVAFDLNASHDLNETTSVISCPSLRSSLKNSPGVIKSRSTSNLSIIDRRRTNSTNAAKTTADSKTKRPSRSRTWSPTRSATTPRSRSAGSMSRRSIKPSPTTIQPTVASPLAYQDLTSESVQALLHSYTPKSLSADIVIECAQDRLVELQSQVIEAYRARSEVAHALEDQRRRYKELVEIYEEYKAGNISPKKPKSLPSSAQLDAMNLELNKEYERTKGLLLELKQLSLQITETQKKRPARPNVLSIEDSSRRSNITHLSPDAKHHLAVIEEKDTEELSDLNSATHIDITVTSPDRIDCQIENVRAASAHQKQCDKLLCKMVVCRQIVRDKLNEIHEHQSNISSGNGQSSEEVSNRLAVLEEVFKTQSGLVEREKGRTRQLAVELSVIQAEIAHLSNGPVRGAQNALSRFRTAKTGIMQAVNAVREIQESNMAMKQTLEAARARMNQESHDQMDYLRTNLRVHQLKQMKYKAESLCDEQNALIHDKSRELTKAVDEFNLISQAWANERELKLYANRQLKERLTLLTGDLTVCQQTDAIQKSRSSSRSHPDPSAPSFSLFGTLCKEIRRLQTRSASLVDALNTLNSGQFDESRLSQIKMLIHHSPSSKTSMIAERPTKGKTKRDTDFGTRSTTEPISVNISKSVMPNRTESTANRQHSDPTNIPSEVESNLKVDISTPVQYQMAQARRRRPVSFYLKRTFGPAPEDVIPEADDETADSPF